MKNIIKLSLLAAGLASAAYAQVPAGQTGLIAGWDFANASDGASNEKIFAALLTDKGTYGDYSTTTDAGGTFTSPGSFRIDGTKGSDVWSTTGSIANKKAVNIGEDLIVTGGDIINTYRRVTVGSGLRFKNFADETSEGYESVTQSGSTLPDAYKLTASAGATKFVFSFDSTGFSDVSLKFVASDLGSGVNSTINWSYSINGGTNSTSLGSSTVVSGGAAQYTVDFTAITGLNANADAVLIGQFAGNTTAAFDNVQILGTAVAAIPEPSSYAALAGVAALGLVAARRRRSTK
jgi:hypothetical protein